MAPASRSRRRAKSSAATAPSDPPASPAARGWLWRLPWVAIALTLLVLVSGAFPANPLRDAATFEPIPYLHLTLSSSYLVLAPVCDVFDTLSLMGIGQHLAILATLAVLFAAGRVWRGVRGGTNAWREVASAGVALVLLLAVYAASMLVPRPMAALAVDTPFNDIVVTVDFHSHTKYSHDGAPWFTPEANRRWHERAGYDVAYITDHRTVRGAQEGIARNPEQAGEGTILLQGLEVGWDGAHVNVLGAERMYRGITGPNLRDVDDTALTLASVLVNHEPIVVFTFPGELRHLHAASGPGTPGVRAMEIVDGAPRGLGDTRRKRTVIATIADERNLALVSGTDNHGWGYTAPAWTLVQIPGWRGMSADSLAEAIDGAIRSRGFEATRVVERRVAATAISWWRLAATIPLVGARMLTTLSPNERVSWLIWIWGITLCGLAWRRRTPATRTGAQ